MADIKKCWVWAIMDASQQEKRKYWTGFGWGYHVHEAYQSPIRGQVGDEYDRLIEAGCQAAFVAIEYSRRGNIAVVYGILEHHRTTHDPR